MATTLNAPFQNIVAGSRATLGLPVGPTYHGILLYLASLTKANLTAIRVRLNKKIIYETTGELLDKMNTYKGGAVDDHFLLIDFTEHQSKDIVSELVGVIATGAGVTSLMVEIDIAAGATVGADELKSWSMVSAPIVDANPLTNIHTLTMQTHNLNGAKTWDIELPHGPTSAHIIKRVWLVESSGAGTITAAECRVNNMPVLETDKAMNEFLQEHYESIPAPGCIAWISP